MLLQGMKRTGTVLFPSASAETKRTVPPVLNKAVVKELLEHPEELGRKAGFADLTPMHGEWIREMINGTEDYTLQAHRGSCKSS